MNHSTYSMCLSHHNLHRLAKLYFVAAWNSVAIQRSSDTIHKCDKRHPKDERRKYIVLVTLRVRGAADKGVLLFSNTTKK